jgi:hypothetical protein
MEGKITAKTSLLKTFDKTFGYVKSIYLSTKCMEPSGPQHLAHAEGWWPLATYCQSPVLYLKENRRRRHYSTPRGFWQTNGAQLVF